jgi:hypothetical protein
MRRAATLSARVLGRSSSKALAFGAWAARLSGFALALLSLALVLPWVTISIIVPGYSQQITQSFWPSGWVTTSGTSSTGAAFDSYSTYIGIINPNFRVEVVGYLGDLIRGLAAGFFLNIVGFVLAILATVFSSRAVRLMSGGRAACCSACACNGCSCCCSSDCCGPQPVDAASRTVRARCSATASTTLNALVAVAAAAAAASVGVGSAGFLAASGVPSPGVSSAAPGIGIASFAVVVAVAAAGLGVAHLYYMAESDFKTDSGNSANPVPVIARQVVSARF